MGLLLIHLRSLDVLLQVILQLVNERSRSFWASFSSISASWTSFSKSFFNLSISAVGPPASFLAYASTVSGGGGGASRNLAATWANTVTPVPAILVPATAASSASRGSAPPEFT